MLSTYTEDCQLKIHNNYGLILPSSIKPVYGTVNIDSRNKLDSFSIIVSDKNSNEIARIPLGPEKSNNTYQTSFRWDLRSKSSSYVESGSYTISLVVDSSNEPQLIKYCSIECKVLDARNILSTARSLRCSPSIIQQNAATQTIFSIYLDIIKDIETVILERLKDNRFEDPYLVACITAYFVQEIANDVANRTNSQFLGLIEKFASKNSISAEQMKNARIGLWALFDFVVNYMSDLEDHVRANAMARCGQRNLTRKDKAQIVSSMVLAIYPHCKTMIFPRNPIGITVEKIVEAFIKVGIKYLCTKHINRSIAICRALRPENTCDVVAI